MIDCNADEILCWLAALALAAGMAFSAEDCRGYTEGTDMYHACESNWEPIDLGVQDEADEPMSQGRWHYGR